MGLYVWICPGVPWPNSLLVGETRQKKLLNAPKMPGRDFGQRIACCRCPSSFYWQIHGHVHSTHPDLWSTDMFIDRAPEVLPGVCQHSMEHNILDIKLVDRIKNSIICSKTRIFHVSYSAATLKRKWAGHILCMSGQLWAKTTTKWIYSSHSTSLA